MAQGTAAQAPTPGDLRALLARARVRVYEVAPDVGLHPGRLGSMLSERIEMPPDVALRLREVVERIVQERAS